MSDAQQANNSMDMSAPDKPAAETRGTGPLYALALALAGTLVYGFYLRGNLPVGADNTLFYAPFYAMRWQGGPPLWNPYSLSGTSLIDNLQAALLYPLRWPFYFAADWRDYFGLYVFLHYAAALAGMAGLLRALGVRRLAALGGAIVFAIGGHMAGRIINPTIFQGSCWLPWLLWGAAGRRPAHAHLTLLAGTMIFTIGSPHLIFYGMIAYGMFFLINTFLPAWLGEMRNAVSKTHWVFSLGMRNAIFCRASVRMLGGRAAALVVAFALGAPTLLPGVLRAQSSIRTHATVETNLADSATLAEIPLILLGGVRGTQVYPEYIDLCCYIGPVALVLALWLALRRSSWRDPRFLGALALVVVGLFFALGKNAGVQYILPWIPVIRNLAGASRALVLTAAGLAILTGLALDALTRRRALGLGLTCLALGALAWGGLAVRVGMETHGERVLEIAAALTQAWALAPGAVNQSFYWLIDAGAGLLAAGAILLLPARLDRARLALLCGVMFALCWHFAPRVLPPTEKRPFFEPPPQAAFMQAERDRAPQAPFRVAGYDPLRLHDTEFDTPHKFQFLMPNMATLYRLEDINGFDPLILKSYLELFKTTSRRAPHNDPIRNLDIAQPDPRLFDLLGVRFLAGNPHDRRLTLIPLQIDPRQAEAEVAEWKTAPAGGAITHWLFVGLLNGALRIPLGTEVARLHVEADEGVFEYPIRNGEELADWEALNYPPIYKAAAFRAVVNKEVWSHTLDPEPGYRVRNAFYRGAIAFGRPLHVRRVAWRLLVPGLIVHVAAQGYRLSPPPDSPWTLRHEGSAGGVAPVYEYRAARARAVLTAAPGTRQGIDVKVDEAHLNAAPRAGAIEWLERGNGVLKLRVQSDGPALLALREIWDAGWRATVNGRGEEILRVNGLLRGIAVPAGRSEVTLVYRPRLPLALLGLAVAALGAYLAGWVMLARRRRA